MRKTAIKAIGHGNPFSEQPKRPHVSSGHKTLVGCIGAPLGPTREREGRSWVRWLRGLFLTGVLLNATSPAFAWQFLPTDVEWSTWPEYCKARYAENTFTYIPGQSHLAATVSQDVIAKWQSIIPRNVFIHIHHYCAALIWLQRARRAKTQTERGYRLNDAVIDNTYVLGRFPWGNIWYARAATLMARIYREKGDERKAEEYLHEALKASREYDGTYLMWSLLYRDRDELEKALDILKKGDTATKGKSSEIKYFIALNCLDLGKDQEALRYGKEAYAMGYPLPGVKKRLRKLGLWTEEK